MQEKSMPHLFAIYKAVLAAVNARKGDLAPGEYDINGDVTFNVRGTLTVGEDYEQRVVQKAKPWAIVSVLMNELNVLREAAGMTGIDLERVAHMADAVDKEIWGRAKKEADAAIAEIKDATWKSCSGKTTWKGTVS